MGTMVYLKGKRCKKMMLCGRRCCRPARIDGFCTAHFRQWKRFGDVLRGRKE